MRRGVSRRWKTTCTTLARCFVSSSCQSQRTSWSIWTWTILRRSPRYTAMVEELRKNVEVDEPELSARMRERGFEVAAGGLGDQFFLARREAILLRFADMKAGPDASFDRIRANLLPRTPLEVSTGVVHVVHDQWEKYV